MYEKAARELNISLAYKKCLHTSISLSQKQLEQKTNVLSLPFAFLFNTQLNQKFFKHVICCFKSHSNKID